jgi:hypothetical protein
MAVEDISINFASDRRRWADYESQAPGFDLPSVETGLLPPPSAEGG